MARLLVASGVTAGRAQARASKEAAVTDCELLAPVAGRCCLDHKLEAERELLMFKFDVKLQDEIEKVEDEAVAEHMTSDDLKTIVDYYESPAYKKYISALKQAGIDGSKAVIKAQGNLNVQMVEMEKKLRAEAATAMPGKKKEPGASGS